MQVIEVNTLNSVMVTEIQVVCLTFVKKMPTELCWDPEHSGVTGNEDAYTSLSVAQPALIDKHQQEQ